MNASKKDYDPPAIIFEADIETNAGSGAFGPTTLNPIEAELHGWNWPVESDYLPPKE